MSLLYQTKIRPTHVAVFLVSFLLGTTGSRSSCKIRLSGKCSLSLRSPYYCLLWCALLPRTFAFRYCFLGQLFVMASVVFSDICSTFLHVRRCGQRKRGLDAFGGLLDRRQLLPPPASVFVGLGISHKVATSNTSSRPRVNRAEIGRRHVSVIFWVSFLCYTTISSTIFQTFACDEWDTGVSYLRVGHSLECYTAEHTLFRIHAGMMTV